MAYESKMLENTSSSFVENGKTISNNLIEWDASVSATLPAVGTQLLITKSSKVKNIGIVINVEYSGTILLDTYLDGYGIKSTSWLSFIGYIINEIPTHPTIALDNANSPASKWFETLEEGNNGVLAGVYGSEMIWDYDIDALLDFTQVNSSSPTNYTAGTYYVFIGGNFANIVAKCIASLSSYTIDGNFAEVNGYLQNIWSSANHFEIWDGNGFGDDNTFEQLTNGTITDLNGQVCKTFHGSIALNGHTK